MITSEDGNGIKKNTIHVSVPAASNSDCSDMSSEEGITMIYNVLSFFFPLSATSPQGTEWGQLLVYVPQCSRTGLIYEIQS